MQLQWVGDLVELGGSLVTAEVVPAPHEHGRGPHSRVTAPPAGHVINGEGRRVYFPGDTDLFDEMEQLGDIDVAMLPIWGSTLGTGHPDPTRAATATGLIRPGMVVPAWSCRSAGPPTLQRMVAACPVGSMIRPSNSSEPWPMPGCRSSCTCSIRASR